MAVVYFDIVDYDSVIGEGKLMAYDTDGDGDFDVEDAKVLLGLTKDGGSSANAESLEEVLNILAEEGSDWIYGFFTFLYDVVSLPVERAEEEEAKEGAEEGEKEKKERMEKEEKERKERREKDEKEWKERMEKEEKERKERREKEEKERKERMEKEEKERKERMEKEEKERKERMEKEVKDRMERMEKEEKERMEKERVAREKAEKERLERERIAKEKERIAKEKAEKERLEQERIAKEKERIEKERLERERIAKEKERIERERLIIKIFKLCSCHFCHFLLLFILAKKKKPKLFNKFDKTIKAEIDAAEKLRKKGKVDEALRAFESLVQQYPQSPRARYGKAQAEDDVAEKLRSNDMLQRAINTYREAAELPDATSDLLMAALKRRAERQQFLGRMRGSLVTLERLVQIFPEDISLKNDLGVAHLLLGDNKGAKKVYEQVLAAAPNNGFAKVHYGFILKSENKIAESIPYLKEGLESGEPGTDDGRFYFHLGDALQRVGDNSAYHWYELGHQRGHFASVWQRSLYNVEGLKAQPWWTPKETGYTDLVKMLERNWKTIRDEALAVMDRNTGQFIPEEENLREKGEWGQYTLWQQGKKVGNSCQGVPKTCSLLEKHPEATGCKRGQIKFSVMHPGTHVWPHTGPTNCRLRMHLGLVIPKQGCRIRCTTETRQWEEGKVLIFDDSFEHEVWQDADSYRLIFIVDVWHPELTAYQRQTLSPI
uniref:Aspartyl/asparaginyl beta-hydroxylase-like n=1 Tax=Sphaeramia orbicularis TaxID=375764 RepID=A0A673B1Z9_9TELE